MNLKHIIGVASLALAVGATAQINLPTDLGNLARSRAMLKAFNPQGSLDQLRVLDRKALTESQTDEAMWMRAEALFYEGRYAEARAAYMAFRNRFPYSRMRNLASLRAAECLYAEASYKDALKELEAIGPEGLESPYSAALAYDTGICAMQTGDTKLARRELANAALSDEYRSAAAFYLGVMDYEAGDFAEARRRFGGVNTATAPGDLAAFYLVSIDLAEGKYDQAATGARSLLRRGNLTPAIEAEMNRVAGEALFRSGEKSEGASYVRKYLAATDKPLPSASYIVGLDEYSKGNYSAAVDLLRAAAASEDPVLSQSAYLYIGQALHHDGDLDAAILAFDKAASSDADPAVREAAYYNYAAAKFGGATVPFGSSSDTFEEFLELYPDGPYSDRVREYLVGGYVADNDYERALQRVEAIRNPGPKALAAKQRIYYVLASQALSDGKHAEASRYLDKAAPLARYDEATAAEIVLLQAENLAAQGKNSQAADKFNDYLSRPVARNAKNRTTAYYGLGYALTADRKYTAAKKAFTTISGSRDLSAVERADVLNRLGDIAYYDSDFRNAAALYEQAFEASPSTGDYAAFNGARMLGFMRDYPAKLEAINKFVADFPSSVLMPDALLETTQTLISLGRNKEAVDTYKKLINDYPGTAQGRQGYLQMAMTLLDMGEREEAREAYRSVIRLYPTSDEALQASSLLKNIYAEDNRGDEYLAFMQSVDNAPEVSASDKEAFTFDAAARDFKATGDAGALEAFIERYPDSSRTPEALRTLAEADYEAGRTPEALARWQLLEQKASTGAMATTARLGIMRSARDLGDYGLAGATADAILTSSAAPAAMREASFTKAVALDADEKTDEALAIWETLARENTHDSFGAKSAFHAAEALLEQGKTEQARKAAQDFVNSGSPQRYWVARGFILLSDAYKAQGKKFEAKEYLEALRDNYPGTETDIQSMIEERLENLD